MYTGPTIIRDGLIFYFDAANSKSLTGNTWLDLTNNKNNGTLMLNPLFDPSNMGIITLDGTSYISIKNANALNSDKLTYSCWLKNRSDYLNWNRLISKKQNYYDLNGYEICLETNDSSLVYISGAGDNFAIIDSRINWLSAEWVNIVVTFEVEEVKLYCNGLYKGNGFINPIISNTNELLLGKIKNEDTTQWVGDKSNVAMYNTILKQNDILYNYNALKRRFI